MKPSRYLLWAIHAGTWRCIPRRVLCPIQLLDRVAQISRLLVHWPSLWSDQVLHHLSTFVFDPGSVPSYVSIIGTCPQHSSRLVNHQPQTHRSRRFCLPSNGVSNQLRKQSSYEGCSITHCRVPFLRYSRRPSKRRGKAKLAWRQKCIVASS